MALTPQQTGSTLYTPSVPATNRFSNTDANSLASQYAQQYGHGSVAQLARIVRGMIYDAAPQQFFDLTILNQKPAQTVGSDEFSYSEMGYGREPIIAGAIGADIAAGTTQVIPIQNLSALTVDTLVIYPTNDRGNVTTINVNAGTITVTAETGSTLPLIPAQGAGQFILANLSPVEADGADSISQYFRVDTIERFNYVQLLVKAQRFGKVEMHKYLNSPQGKNYIDMQKKRMMQQFRIDLSNIYWNGNLAEVTLANGQKAKTCNGVFPMMQQAGSPNISVSLANLPAAVEELALDTEFGEYGQTKFLYGTNKAIHYLSQQYKRDLTRYTPDNKMADLELDSINIGSTKIVFVPMQRFSDRASFPEAFSKRLILLDQKNITPIILFGEQMGETLSRVDNGNYNTFTDNWISATFSVEYNNPLGGGWIDITNLPN